MFYTSSTRSTESGTSHQAEQTKESGWAGLLRLVRRSFAVNPLLALLGVVMAFIFIATLVGVAVDPRAITGVPAWLKPAKFAISISIYSFTLLWLLSYIEGRRRLKNVVASMTALGLAAEMVIIVGQVIRGTTSHFNVATPLDALLFRAMGGIIVFVWLMGIITAGMLVRQRLADRAFAWSLRLGVAIAPVGMAVAFLMVIPTAQQMAADGAGQEMMLQGAHSVGVADGGPGLPLLGWSTVAGDLRIPHFIGLHALQVLPFIGWLLQRRRFTGLGMGHRVALVLTCGLSYLALLVLLTLQALRGQSIVAPDALTLQAFAALISATALAALAITAHARLRSQHSQLPDAAVSATVDAGTL